MKKILFFFFVLFALVFLFKDGINNLITGKTVYETVNETMLPQDFGKLEVYFCPKDDCENIFVNEIKKSISVDCAFFDLDLDNVTDVIREKQHRLVIDNSNYKNIKMNFARSDDRQEFMHNKFCILDNSEVITGSMNPTRFDAYRNNNNLVIIESKTLAQNYQFEFNELWGGIFGDGEKVKYPKLYFNGFLVENYFCSEDHCEEQVIELLKKAQSRIYFMTFSFTSDGIGEEIIRNFYSGIDVRGVFDASQAGNRYSEYNKFRNLGIDVRKDGNKGFMHHKVFIVDDSVVFGSYNPTSAGNEKNDENVLIIHDKNITEKFVQEFQEVYFESLH